MNANREGASNSWRVEIIWTSLRRVCPIGQPTQNWIKQTRRYYSMKPAVQYDSPQHYLRAFIILPPNISLELSMKFSGKECVAAASLTCFWHWLSYKNKRKSVNQQLGSSRPNEKWLSSARLREHKTSLAGLEDRQRLNQTDWLSNRRRRTSWSLSQRSGPLIYIRNHKNRADHLLQEFRYACYFYCKHFPCNFLSHNYTCYLQTWGTWFLLVWRSKFVTQNSLQYIKSENQLH